MKTTRFMIFNINNISIQGFETEKEAKEKCEFMKNYHQTQFYVKKVEFEV